MKQLPQRKPREVARKTDTYRWWLRGNAIKWNGVEPDRKVEHPPLVAKVSKRGEKHYVELW